MTKTRGLAECGGQEMLILEGAPIFSSTLRHLPLVRVITASEPAFKAPSTGAAGSSSPFDR